MQAWSQAWSRERWLSFLVWLDSGISGIDPRTLRQTLGPIAAWLPQARQVAASLNTWLLALLAERQRLGLAVTAGYEHDEPDVLEADSSQQPYRCHEVEQQERWLCWRLAAEALRLVRLAEALGLAWSQATGAAQAA